MSSTRRHQGSRVIFALALGAFGLFVLVQVAGATSNTGGWVAIKASSFALNARASSMSCCSMSDAAGWTAAITPSVLPGAGHDMCTHARAWGQAALAAGGSAFAIRERRHPRSSKSALTAATRTTAIPMVIDGRIAVM